jgi:hypothetical protein
MRLLRLDTVFRLARIERSVAFDILRKTERAKSNGRRSVSEQSLRYRNWIADNLDRTTLRFPSDDEVWAFITTQWPRILTHDAEKVLGEAMKSIPVAA